MSVFRRIKQAFSANYTFVTQGIEFLTLAHDMQSYARSSVISPMRRSLKILLPCYTGPH
jgi:hypothetical protein